MAVPDPWGWGVYRIQIGVAHRPCILWGMRLENYKDFNVCVPRLDNQVRVAYDQNDMANLLDHGSVSGYLNNIRKNNMSSITDIKVHFCRQRSFSESLNLPRGGESDYFY